MNVPVTVFELHVNNSKEVVYLEIPQSMLLAMQLVIIVSIISSHGICYHAKKMLFVTALMIL